MSVKIFIISFFLIIFTIMLIAWINSLPDNISKPKNATPSVERIKVDPSPSDDFPQPTSDSSKPNICQNKCGDGICQLVACQGSGCPCAENDVTCPVDCR